MMKVYAAQALLVIGVLLLVAAESNASETPGTCSLLFRVDPVFPEAEIAASHLLPTELRTALVARMRYLTTVSRDLKASLNSHETTQHILQEYFNHEIHKDSERAIWKRIAAGLVVMARLETESFQIETDRLQAAALKTEEGKTRSYELWSQQLKSYEPLFHVMSQLAKDFDMLNQHYPSPFWGSGRVYRAAVEWGRITHLPRHQNQPKGPVAHQTNDHRLHLFARTALETTHPRDIKSEQFYLVFIYAYSLVLDWCRQDAEEPYAPFIKRDFEAFHHNFGNRLEAF